MASDVDVETLIMNLLATKEEMEDLVRDLLIMLIKEHKDCSDPSQGAEVGLAEILSKPDAMTNLSILKYPVNLNKIYDQSTSPAMLRPTIDILTLDLTFMVDVLKSIPGFPTCKKQAKLKSKCINSNHQKCCNACNHTCGICSKPSCPKGCPGKGIDHPCLCCKGTKFICLKNSKICCSRCNNCVRCNLLKAVTNQCPLLRLNIGVDTVQLLRNLISHLTKEDCESFLKGKTTLEGFSLCIDFRNFKEELVATGKNILDYMSNPHCFNRINPLPLEDRYDRVATIKLALGNKKTLLKFFTEVIVKSASKVKDEKITKHMDSLLQKIIDQIQSVKISIKESEMRIVGKVTSTGNEAKDEIIQTRVQVLEEIKTLKIGEDEGTKRIKEKQKYIKAVDCLKEIYKKRHVTVKRASAIVKTNDISPENVLRDEIIVDVHLQQSTSHDNTEMKMQNMFENSDDYIIVSGAQGVGKTTLINTLSYRWATGDIWNDVDGERNFDFVFTLYCRQLNKYKKRNFTITDVLNQEFHEVFQHISYGDLIKNKHKVLLILEGFDEVSVYNEFKEVNDGQLGNVSEYTQLIYDLVDPFSSISPFNRLITCRPTTDLVLSKKFKEHKIKQLILIGFDADSQNDYIKKYFSDKPELAKITKEKIAESPIFQLLSPLPIYCWVLCSLVEGGLPQLPITCSEIYATFILIQFRNQGKKHSDKALYQFINNPDVAEGLLRLAEIAFESLRKGKIIFTEKDIDEKNVTYLREAIQYSALVEKISGNEFEPESYQFTHLIIQEFLAAYYLYYYKLFTSLTDTDQIFLFSQQSILLFLSGLIGSSLTVFQNNSLQLLASQRILPINVDQQDEEMFELFKNADVYIQLRSNLYYEMYFEYQHMIQVHLKFDATLDLSASMIHTPFDYIRIKYFLNHIQQNSSSFPFTGLKFDSTQFPLEILQLIKHQLKQLSEFRLVACKEGTVLKISNYLPSTLIALPTKGINISDWSSYCNSIEKYNIITTIVSGEQGYDTIPDLLLKKCRHLMGLCLKDIILSSRQLQLLVNSFHSKMRLKVISFEVDEFNVFDEFCKNINAFQLLDMLAVTLSLKCTHYNKYRGKITTQHRIGNFVFEDPQEIIICKKCHRMVRIEYQSYLLKQNIFPYVSIPKVENRIEDGMAVFSWTFFIVKSKQLKDASDKALDVIDANEDIFEILNIFDII